MTLQSKVTQRDVVNLGLEMKSHTVSKFSSIISIGSASQTYHLPKKFLLFVQGKGCTIAAHWFQYFLECQIMLYESAAWKSLGVKSHAQLQKQPDTSYPRSAKACNVFLPQRRESVDFFPKRTYFSNC